MRALVVPFKLVFSKVAHVVLAALVGIRPDQRATPPPKCRN